MPPSENEERAQFMARHQLIEATWDEAGLLMQAKRNPAAAPRPVADERKGPAAQLRDAFADKLRREHETRFAASHFRPPLTVPKPAENDVPRAVLARGASDGRPAKKRQR